MLDCEQARDALHDAVDGELSWLDRLRLRLHLFLCPPCRHEGASLRRAIALLRRGGCRGQGGPTRRAKGPSDEK